MLALIRAEPGGALVADRIGGTAISTVVAQEVAKKLMVSGLREPTSWELIGELRLHVEPHSSDDAYAATGLHGATKEYG